MTRTKPPNGEQFHFSGSQLKALASVLVTRANLAARTGQQQYGGSRDIYQALGYPTDLKYEDYLGRYYRQDIAKAVIDRPVRATWHGGPELWEANDIEDTPLEEAYEELDKRIGLKNRFARVDKLTCIGRYGVLLLGLDDVHTNEGFAQPVTRGTRKLMYVQPFGEGTAKIDKYESNPNSPRFGQPLIYSLSTTDPESSVDRTVQVHYTRVIHIVADTLESEVMGAPILESVFNRLLDLEKLVGGDAEMFWRGARPGYTGKVDPDYQMTTEMIESLKDQADEFEHNLRRILINEGVDLEALAQQIADPANHVDIQLQMISAVTGIPKRILTGSERGELSSTQDQGEWLSYVKARREGYAELQIVRPFVDRCIELGVLPPPAEDDYSVKWPDLFALSEKERVEIGRNRAMALREYSTNPMAEAIVPPDAFNEFFLGLNDEQRELIEGMRDEAAKEDLLMGGDKMLEAETAPPPAPIMNPVRGKAGSKNKTTRQE